MNYGYARVSTATQKLDRQLEELAKIGIECKNIYTDKESGKDFITYQNYYMEHFAEADIPYDFNEYVTAQRKYENILTLQGAPADNSNVFSFESFSPEAKMAYFIYIHEYWLLTFENARKTFNLPYTYYLVPKEDTYTMVYMIDGERTHKGPDGKMADEGEFLYLGDEYVDPIEEYPVQWNTWFTGERQNDFQVWNNKWGHTYAYYTPLIIDGQKLGLIGTEIEVETINKKILFISLKISGGIALALIIGSIIIASIINSRYLRKITILEAEMQDFAHRKDPSIAQKIKSEINGRNEITSLSDQFANMIIELQEYMTSLVYAKEELTSTKNFADKMNSLANKDALTGIRNKTAYDTEVKLINKKIQEGKIDLGLAMIDLNFLKVINDNYGHEKGNIAIKKLCKTVCNVFKHSPVFRIGGDEFVVILEKNDFEHAEELKQKFIEEINNTNRNNLLEPWEKISAAIGLAFIDDCDKNISDIFARADKNMYEHKKQMKAERRS